VHTIARILIGSAGLLIAAGGTYDILIPKLPRGLAAICGDQPRALRLARELLRALGGALLGVGAAVFSIAAAAGAGFSVAQSVLVLVLVIPAEGINALAMHRVGSPWQFPAAFLGIALVGVMLALAR